MHNFYFTEVVAKTCLMKEFQMWMDGFEKHTSNVIVVGATNFSDKVPPAIFSRFGKKLCGLAKRG